MRNRQGIEEEMHDCCKNQNPQEITASALVLILEVLLDIRQMVAEHS